MITQPELYDPLIDSYPIMLDGSVSGDNRSCSAVGPTLPQSFPSRLYELLDDADKQGFDHIISWQHGGRSFKVHQPESFALHIMQRYFAQTTKFKSFQRQMNTYGYVFSWLGTHTHTHMIGQEEDTSHTQIPQPLQHYPCVLCSWKKIHHGPNKGGYFHYFFVRGHPDLCYKMVRRSASKTDLEDLSDNSLDHQISRRREEGLGETNDMGPLLDHIVHATQQNSSVSNECELDAFIAVFGPPQEKMAEKKEETRQKLSHKAPLHKKSPFLDLDLRLDDDFEGVYAMLKQDTSFTETAEPLSSQSILREDIAPAKSVHDDLDEDDSLHLDHSFPFKLHLMLENATKDGYDHIVSWLNNGTAFKVLNCKEFVDKVMPFYFDQSKYESFRRQLNLYGFSRVTRGADRGVISHPNFVQADRSLCKMIMRKPQTKSGSAKVAESQPYSHRTAYSTTSNQEVIL